MSEERLRLIAEFRDQASAGVRKLGRELGEVRETPGMVSAKRWMNDFAARAEGFQRGGAGVSAVMSGLGIGGLAAAGGIASAVKAFRDLADQTNGLKSIARETGLAVDQINIFKTAARDMHIDPEAMSKGLQVFAGNMEEARRHLGEIYGQLSQIAPEFARKITGEDATSAVKDVLGWLSRIPEEQQRAGRSLADGIQLQKKWTAEFFGSDDLAKLVEQGPAKLAEAMERAAKNTPKISQGMIDGAEAFTRSVNAFSDSIERLETKAAPAVFGRLKDLVEEFTTTFDNLERAGHWFEEAKTNPGKALGQVGTVVQDQLTLSPRQKYDELHGEGLFAKPESAEAAQARLQAMQAEVDAIKSKLAADKNPVSFPVRHADDFSRLNELGAALRALRENSPDLPPQPQTGRAGLLHRSSYGGSGNGGLLHNAAYNDDDGSSRGGLGSLTLEFRDVIASGTKAGFLAAFRELQTGEPVGGAGGGGFMNASYGGGGSGSFGSGAGGRRAPSLRYGRQHDGAAFSSADGGAVPTGAHTPLKDLIAAHETGSTGAAGYDTVYGHAERGGPLAPPKPVSQMTIGDVLAYQRAMKPRAGSPAFPVGRAQWTESTLRGLTRGMDPSTVFSPDVQEKLFDRSIAGRMGQGVAGLRSEWDSLRGVDAGQIQGAADGHRKAQAAAAAAMPKGAGGKMPEWLDDKSRRELSGVNKALAGDLLAASEQTGLHFRVLQGLRTQAEAEHNAITGRGVRNSQHLFGAAADIAVQDAQGHDIKDRAAYKRFADAYTAHSRAGGGSGRWLGDLPGRWGSDIGHFDQGIRYGQTHRRDLYGIGGPTKDDIAQGNAEAYKSPQNPFMQPRKSLLDEANKAGLGSTTVKHEGGAVIEIRGLPQGKGTRTSTSGMIEAVNLRRGGPLTQVG